jgi:hypothetical protein
MRKPWRDYIDSSPHELRFLHLEELEDFGLNDYKDQLPICLEEINGKYEILISKQEMNEYKSEFDLINSLNDKL